MCDHCGNLNHTDELRDPGRRRALLAGAGLAAAPLIAGIVDAAQAQDVMQVAPTAPFKARAWAASSATSPFVPIEINRRAVGPKDVRVEILYAGICHSDIHAVRSEWGPARYPIVPGHEIIGRVSVVGSGVTKFKVGDIAGVGCMVDSCGTCENCLADREQNCLNGTTFTYDSDDKVSGGVTYGGYSTAVVVTERFAIRIPPGVNLAAMTPVLCAGITTFSPMQHWRLERGQRVGVIGLGGLGHMAVKLGVARGAEVTVFTTTPGKIEDAKRLGAREAVLWEDMAAMQRLRGHFDLMIATVPQAFPVQRFMDLLKLDATLVNVGALEDISGLNGMLNGFGRKSFAGSMIGGIAETQEVIDYCAARSIAADVEIIRPDQIAEAYDRVIGKAVRYRFVIDMAAA